MIAVLGRPAWTRSGPGHDTRPAGLAAAVALAVARAGGRVELIGSLGDDPEGDVVVVALGRAGVGHAALLRDPAARTPTADAAGWPLALGPTLPRSDAGDIELALRYLPEVRVLVVAAELDVSARRAALEAAAYHAAAVVLVVPDGAPAPEDVDPSVTVIAAPAEISPDDGSAMDDAVEEEDPDAINAFAGLVAGYARYLASGEAPGPAFRSAAGAAGWEPAGA